MFCQGSLYNLIVVFIESFVKLVHIDLRRSIDVNKVAVQNEVLALCQIDNYVFLHFVTVSLVDFSEQILQLLFTDIFDFIQKLNEVSVKKVVGKFHITHD